MAHFADIEPGTNKVLRVTFVAGSDVLHGATMLAQVVGGTWTQCDNVDAASDSIVAPGYTYDPIADAFIAPRIEP